MRLRLSFLLLFVCVLNLNAQLHYDTVSTAFVGPGVRYTKIVVSSVPWSIDVVEVDLTNPHIRF